MARLAQNNRVRVLLVEDHPLVRRGLRLTIGEEQGMGVRGQAQDRESAPAAVQASRPVLAIMDLQLNNSSGLDLTKRILDRHPNTMVLVLSMHDEPFYAQCAVRAGARSCISPLAIIQQDADRAVIQIQVPQGVDVLAFGAADLAVREALFSGLSAGAVNRTAPPALERAVGFHEAPDGRIGRLGTQGGLLPGQHRQVIRVELATPVGMLLVSEGQSSPPWLSQGRLLGRTTLRRHKPPTGCLR